MGDSALNHPTLVLNRTWTPVHVTSARRALCLLYRESAQVVATDTLAVHDFGQWVSLPNPPTVKWICTPRISVPVPEVILLQKYDKVPCHQAPFTRRNLFQRDDHTCQYCGRRYGADRLSIDHVTPKARGGTTSWENCVLACTHCNARKADRSPGASGLRLRRRPQRPRWSPYLNLRGWERLDSWRRFTPQAMWEDGIGATGS